MASYAEASPKFGRLPTGLAIAVALLAWAAAAQADEPSRIVLVLPPAGEDAPASAARQGAAAAAEALGARLELAPLAAGAGAQAIAAAIDAALESRPAGIVAAIPDADLLAPALARAADSPVPLVTIGEGFDVARPLGAALHVGQDDHQAGRAAGEAMRQRGAGGALCLAGSPLGLAQDLRCKGLAEAFDRPVTLLPVAGGAAEVETALAAALEADPGIDAVISVASGPAGEAAVAAVEALGRAARVHVAAFDPAPGFLAALAADRAAFAIDQQSWLQGWLAVALIAQHRDSGLLPVDNIRTGPRLITPESARAPALSQD